MQRIRFVTNDHGMARIVAAIETRNIVDLGADKIGRLALTFVAPLGTDQNNSRHVVAPPRVCDFASKPYPRPYKDYPAPSTGYLPDMHRSAVETSQFHRFRLIQRDTPTVPPHAACITRRVRHHTTSTPCPRCQAACKPPPRVRPWRFPLRAPTNAGRTSSCCPPRHRF